jgi:hypothetical protein
MMQCKNGGRYNYVLVDKTGLKLLKYCNQSSVKTVS